MSGSQTAERTKAVPHTERLRIHIAHENDDGTDPTHFLCGQPIRVLLPGPGRYAGDPVQSECATCNRINATYALGA